MSDLLLEAIFTTVGAIVGAAFLFIIAWRKAKPEMENLQSESNEHQATAAKSALESTEIATKQLYATQKELYEEQSKRHELEKKIEEMDKEIKKLRAAVTMLEAQVVHLGGTPITNKV